MHTECIPDNHLKDFDIDTGDVPSKDKKNLDLIPPPRFSQTVIPHTYKYDFFSPN